MPKRNLVCEQRTKFLKIVRVGRIELPSPAWQAGVIPLNYTRIMVRTEYPRLGGYSIEVGIKKFFNNCFLRLLAFLGLFSILKIILVGSPKNFRSNFS